MGLVSVKDSDDRDRDLTKARSKDDTIIHRTHHLRFMAAGSR
jgi:hypothetical protein